MSNKSSPKKKVATIIAAITFIILVIVIYNTTTIKPQIAKTNSQNARRNYSNGEALRNQIQFNNSVHQQGLNALTK